MRKADVRGVLILLGLVMLTIVGVWVTNRLSPAPANALPSTEGTGTTFAEGAQAFAALIQAAALIVGGVWAYLRFVKGRLWYPRASLRHTITHRALGGDRVLLRVNTTITNSGVVILPIREALFRVQQVLPADDDVLEAVEDAVGKDALEVSWPGLKEREHKWPAKEIEIEPGETDEITCDFVLEGEIRTVQVYSFVHNARKQGRKQPLGWPLTTFYDVRPDEPHVVEKAVEDLTGRHA